MTKTHTDTSPRAPQISIETLGKTYITGRSSHTALKSVSLDIHRGEFFTLLGPSGCGKTSLLRILAGFESVTSGRVLLNGADISLLPPEERPINTVFQHYALFPHMTVAQNIAFGLRQLRRSAAEVKRRTDEMLALVQMERFATARPTRLSGGQQQRVALARALAPQPEIILLDEPLSALDLKLRQAMRFELKRLQKETGITFVFVTHDQEEALAMSDRIAVLAEGRVQQLGRPDEIYERPPNGFVASFIGDSNLLPATVIARPQPDEAICRLESGAEILAHCDETLSVGSRITLSIRPEQLRLGTEDGAQAIVQEVAFLGDRLLVSLSLEGAPLRAFAPGRAGYGPGLELGVNIPPRAAWVVAEAIA